MQNEEILLQAESLSRANIKLEKTNADLVELNEEKDGLIEVVAHDLRSPLAACVGLVDVAEMSLDDQEETLGYLGKMKTSILRLIDMISRILESNSMDLEGKDLHMEQVNLSKLLKEVGDGFKLLAEKKEITIENLVDNAQPHIVLADQGFLRQVYENLLSNAIKFSPERQKIHIKLKAENGKITSSITDNGPGIGEDEQHRLFKKYQKLSAKPTAGEHSTGLGLSIVKRFVDAMDGRIWCESKLGHGATFSVEFKAVE